MKKKFIVLIFLSASFFIYSQSDYETNFLQGYLSFENFFLNISGDYGTTFFPFLGMGYGGRENGLSHAFTGVADDIGTLESNPAGTASLSQTELFLSHVKLMGDVNYNTLAYTMRFNDLAFGVGARVLYMPFVHFDQFGDNVGSGIITNSVITANISYNFLRSYDFFGLSAGANVKLYIYGVPDTIAKNQTKVNVAFDMGLLTRFNFLKAYSNPEKNLGIGLAVLNLGPFTDGEPPPTTISLGLSYKPIYQLLFSTDFNYLIDYSSYTYKNWSVDVGIEWKFTKFSSLLGGVTIKSSPSFSLGVNIEFEDFKITAVYSPDFLDVSKFSVSASLKLGDMGRGKKELQVKKMFSNALRLMDQGNYDLAIDALKDIIKFDRTFTPAKRSLEQCSRQIQTESDLNVIFNKRLQ